MLGLLSWNGYDKPSLPTTQLFVPSPANTQPTDMPKSTPMKRKRSSGAVGDTMTAIPNHLSKPNFGNSDAPAVQPLTHVSDSSIPRIPDGLPTPSSSPVASNTEDLDKQKVPPTDARQQKARQVIQQQINLEILLKHNELRLIDQELAKCQIAMEQLRRCSEIPYPSTRLSENVTHGSGPALRKSFSGRLPSSPAPWGVTDGPYSRHYSRWLLPDASFHGGEPEMPVPTSGKRPAKGRIRGSFAEDHSHATHARSQRGSKHLKSLPAGYGQPKEKASGPLVLKRKSDGVMVKLVCPDCGRHDFGSAQGFINHCRIGHARNFTSHDAAAEKCGEPVEYDAKGAMIGIEPAPAPTSSFVHPLIRSARLLPSDASPASPNSKTNLPNLDGASDVMNLTSKSQPEVSPDFRASLLTPNLSALIRHRGLGFDLQDMVTEAKTKVEFPESEDEDMDEESGSATPPEPNGQHPQVGGTRQIMTHSKSPHTSPLLQSRLPVQTSTFRQPQERPSLGESNLAHDLSNSFVHPTEPSPTTESNQAPSLIDDDEEFEPHSPTSSSASEHAEDGEVDFHVQDEEDSQQVTLRSDFQPTCTQPTDAESLGPRVRRPSALRRQAESREEKHVTFVSPSPAREVDRSDRKRRKVVK